MTAPRRDAPPDLFEDAAVHDDSYFAAHHGLFARQEIHAMARRKLIQAYRAIEEPQYQPASLDLGSARKSIACAPAFCQAAAARLRSISKALIPSASR